jgi:hypothetical protein
MMRITCTTRTASFGADGALDDVTLEVATGYLSTRCSPVHGMYCRSQRDTS